MASLPTSFDRRAVAAWVRAHLRPEYGVAGLLAACALLVIAQADNLLGVVLVASAASYGAWRAWRAGDARWRCPPDGRQAWAEAELRRIFRPLGPVVHFDHAVEIGGDMPLVLDLVVDGNRKRGIVAILADDHWDRGSEAARMIGETLRDACDRIQADRCILWLPFARPADWKTRLWPHLPGVRVVRGGPWRLRPLARRWHSRVKAIGQKVRLRTD